MTGLRKNLNEVMLIEHEANVPLSRLRETVARRNKGKVMKQEKRKETMEKEKVPVEESSKKGKEVKQEKRKEKEGVEEVPVDKKPKVVWKPEHLAKPVGELVKVTGKGKYPKSHYEKFKFRGEQYDLEDTVLLFPEEGYTNPHVAIVKDIYVQGKEGYVKLQVQWLYRLDDVDQKAIAKWESKDIKELFYSFHRDEVAAESVKQKCIVHFVAENQENSDLGKYKGFVVRRVYHHAKNTLEKFNAKEFNKEQQDELKVLVEKTASDVEKEQKALVSGSRRVLRRRTSADVRGVRSASSLEATPPAPDAPSTSASAI